MKTTFVEHFETSKAFACLFFAWKTQGLYTVESYKFYHIIHAVFVIVGINLISTITFGTQLFYVCNLKQLLNNLPMNICIIACACKYFIIFAMRRQLLDVSRLLSELDTRVVNINQQNFQKSFIILSRRLFSVVLSCYIVASAMAAVNAAFSNRKVLQYEIWLPFDWQASVFNYWCAWTYLCFSQSVLVFQNLICDVSGPTYLIVLNGHLEIVMDRIECLRNDSNKTDEENYKDLVDCIKDHRAILNIFDILQKTFSYTIFIQFVATALAICMLALTYLLYPPTLTEMMTLTLFIIAEIIEILPCCFYSNVFMSTSDRLVTAIYSSNWLDQSLTFKKSMIIFMQMAQRTNVLVVGKLIPVTLATFVWIMKISYSLLTLANRIQ